MLDNGPKFPLAGPQGILELLAAGDVLHHPQRMPDPTRGVPHRRHGQPPPDHATVLAIVALLDLIEVSLARHELLEEPPVQVAVVGMGEVGEGHAAQFLGRVPEQLL
ncbi:hypothetical protein D3C72_1276050 [compost metagenome]